MWQFGGRVFDLYDFLSLAIALIRESIADFWWEVGTECIKTDPAVNVNPLIN
jgi:hypothetical protein